MVALKITSVLALTLSTITPVFSAAIEARGLASDHTRCYTRLGSKSLKQVKTSWRTEFTPCTTTVTVSSKSTSTPPGVTSTSIVLTTTTITAPTNLLTQTATITNTETDSVTETDTATSTETSTISTSSVATLATSSGFIPVQTSLPGSTCDSSCGTNPNTKRSEEAVNQPLDRRSLNPAINPFTGSAYANQYSQSVSCCRWTHKPLCSKKTTTIVSVIAVPTPTTTTTITSTISTTFVPSATTTISTTLISTISETATITTTSTTTTTQTTVTATSTIYAACASNNIADLYNGAGVYNFNEGSGPSANVVSVAATSAYDCCVANFNYGTGYSQFFAYSAANAACYISYGTTCASGASSKRFSVNTGTVTYAFGNGNCGEIVSSV